MINQEETEGWQCKQCRFTVLWKMVLIKETWLQFSGDNWVDW